ncbi:MAG: hypothetical protein ACRC5T_00940, partial [Cetobacterium sp.]
FCTKKELHVKDSFIRTAVNMTNSLLDLSYSDNAELSESKPFSPVVSSGTVNIDINAIEWGHSVIDGKVNEYKMYEMSNRYPVYLFSGVREEKVCDFVGFVSSFNIIPTQDKIELRFEDKTSLYWNEEIPTSDRFDGELVIDAIAKIMQYPRHKMKYSDPMLNDSHFFTVSNLTTKQYVYYKDLFSDLSKELMFRMSFDACENIVLQSEVVLSEDYSGNTFIEDMKAKETTFEFNDENNIFDIEKSSSSRILYNKIENNMLEYRPFFDKEFFMIDPYKVHLVNTQEEALSKSQEIVTNDKSSDNYIYIVPEKKLYMALYGKEDNDGTRRYIIKHLRLYNKDTVELKSENPLDKTVYNYANPIIYKFSKHYDLQ